MIITILQYEKINIARSWSVMSDPLDLEFCLM